MLDFCVFSVYDTKAETYGMPVFFHTRAEAVRALAIQASKPGTALADFPGDFELWFIGKYDEGMLYGESRDRIGSVLDLIGDAEDILAAHGIPEVVPASAFKKEA